MLLASDLSATLCAKLAIKETLDLDESADQFSSRFGTDALIALLKSLFTTKAIKDYHLLFGSIPWHRIYTTNWDNVIETAFLQNSVAITSVSLDSDVYSVPKDSPLCIHINGTIDRLTREALVGPFKLLISAINYRLLVMDFVSCFYGETRRQVASSGSPGSA